MTNPESTKSFWQYATIITKVLRDKCWYAIFEPLSVFAEVHRVYPEEVGYSHWKLLEDPSYIIDNIYLGSAYNAADYCWLKDNQINIIVNVTRSISNYYPEEFTYHHFAADDLDEGSLQDYYQDFCKLVNEADPDQKILVHCYAGRSRSAALVLYYLIREHNYSLEDALVYLKSKRPLVNLNQKFIDEIFHEQSDQEWSE